MSLHQQRRRSVRPFRLQHLRKRRQGMFFRELFQHAHSDYCAGINLCEPALHLFHQRYIRDALPVQDGDPDSVVAPRAPHFAYKILRMKNAAQQRDVCAQIFHKGFLWPMHHLFCLWFRYAAMFKPARIHQYGLPAGFNEYSRPALHDGLLHIRPRFRCFSLAHCKYVFHRITCKIPARMIQATRAHSITQNKIAYLIRVGHPIQICKKRGDLPTERKWPKDQIRIDISSKRNPQAFLVFCK